MDSSNALVKMLDGAADAIRAVAPRYVNVERLVALAIEARLRNPALADCDPASVVNFCKKCAEAGTDRVGPGGMHPVPFKNTKAGVMEMVAIPDWRLLIEKAKKAKALTHATAEVVREGDLFAYSRGMRPDLTHEPKLGGDGKIIATYCVYTLPDGARDFVVMAWSEIEAIRNRSKAWQSFLRDKRLCPWNTDEAEMAKKTAVKRAMKLFEGASIELTALLDADNVVHGLADITPEIRPPIAMPRELAADSAPPSSAQPIAQTASQPATTTPTEQPHDQERPPADGNGPTTVVGMVEHISSKSGKTGGKSWTRYGIKIDGRYFNTFDDGACGIATEARAIGRAVAITFAEKNGYANLKTIEILGEPAPAPEDTPIADALEWEV